ncbi:hypothetical protein [Reichenbachiella sp.]|uniref:hypothetical protein n=1 Tax=Reichenbachiella sp. TaxID=2184521 RepID=UPI003296DDD9
MKNLRTYLEFQLSKLRKSESWVYLIILIAGFLAALSKYGLISTLQTLFIFVSALVLAIVISDLAIKIFWKRRRQSSDLDIGKRMFSNILLFAMTLTHIVLNNLWITKYSLSIGVFFGALIVFLSTVISQGIRR